MYKNIKKNFILNKAQKIRKVRFITRTIINATKIIIDNNGVSNCTPKTGDVEYIIPLVIQLK